MARTRKSRRAAEPMSARSAVEALSQPGPYPVLRGDLALVGMPGLVFTPAQGLGLPAIAFGHDWLQPPDRYAYLLRHLASWGIVAAAPATQRGPLPSHTRFAADLRSTLEVCTGVRLGTGAISVDPAKLGAVGHGMGGGCAIIAAAAEPELVAVVTIALSETRPSAIDAARGLRAPTLHVVAGKDEVAPPVGHAEPVAAAAAGPVWLRTITKASHLGVLDGRHWSDLLLVGGPETSTQRMVRALTTAFLLRTLLGDDRGSALIEGDVSGTKLVLAPSLKPSG